MALSQTLLIGLGLSLASAIPVFFGESTSAKLAPLPADEQAIPAAYVATLTWTADTQGWYGGDWAGGVQAAAGYTGDGFSDWRLPTVPELQAALQIPSGQPGSWGVDTRNPGGSGRGWTSRTSGAWAYAVTIVKDGNGFVIPSQSGESKKYLKGSNFASTKFVRP